MTFINELFSHATAIQPQPTKSQACNATHGLRSRMRVSSDLPSLLADPVIRCHPHHPVTTPRKCPYRPCTTSSLPQHPGLIRLNNAIDHGHVRNVLSPQTTLHHHFTVPRSPLVSTATRTTTGKATMARMALDRHSAAARK